MLRVLEADRSGGGAAAGRGARWRVLPSVAAAVPWFGACRALSADLEVAVLVVLPGGVLEPAGSARFVQCRY